eukprot:CAMPEP_0184868778 /NCGR_PEP_ID=MMETSP0580-20130426/31751_1 /TAXON_ID=1118495 /ORGANISM="Dactyliosolen fragilissimus" /LENGTH=333 /DNA_ID=CAMNT_0027369885 /DNA_START=200 /DNA_END=1198 /DNA_ORIENTATION=-
MNTEEISVQDLMNENVETEMMLDDKHIVVQILRIITPQEGKNGNAMTRYQRSNNTKKITFSRILLCRNNRSLCYIMISNEKNRRLFHRDLLLRDNGTITIGSYLRIIAPLPVERNMQENPLIESFLPAIAMKHPPKVSPIVINNYIEGNQSGVAFLVGASIKVHQITPLQTTCSGKHCDKQRPLEWTFKLNRGCGCYGTNNIRTSNVAFMMNMTIEKNYQKISVNNFSSTTFMRMFMDKGIPSNVNVATFDKASASKALRKLVEDCIDFINMNDGFDVVMWYSRGEINDQSLVGLNVDEESQQADSGKMNYHIVSVRPVDGDILKTSTLIGDE